MVYYQKGQLAEARSEFQKALAIDPSDAGTHYLLGAAQTQMGRLDEALREFQEALALDPNLPEPYFGLGTVYMLQGHKEKAIEAFERFLELDLGQDPRARAEAERALKELKGQ